MHVMEPNDELALHLRRFIRRAQQQLIAHPDPADPWWFLVDPDASEDDEPTPTPDITWPN